MDDLLDISCLQCGVVIVPGGHDRDGRPIVLVNVPADSTSLDISIPLQYLFSIFSECSISRGVTIIVDARKGSPKTIRSCIRQTRHFIAEDDLSQIIVLRPDGFWDKQLFENCTHMENHVVYIARCRLTKFVDQSQVPYQLGGDFIYDHEKWIENRQKVEDFLRNAAGTLKDLEELHQFLSNCTTDLKTSDLDNALNTTATMAETTRILVHNAVETGQNLLHNIEQANRTRKLAADSEFLSTPHETTDNINRIDKLLVTVKTKQQEIEETWMKMQNTFVRIKELSQLEEGVSKVINWILGSAEQLLNSKQRVGYDVGSAEELRCEHETIELQCWNAYGAYAELVHKIDNFPKDGVTIARYNDLISQKDFMDFVCRSFALRLEKRRNILITSLRFFRLVSEYFDKTGEVFDSLLMGSKFDDLEIASYKLNELQESEFNLDSVEQEVIKDGEKLSDLLLMPVKDALGREILVDYSEDIVNVRDILDATIARKNIFTDSVELQKLTLQQISHIYNYEQDVKQAIHWLDELFDVLIQINNHVGCTVYEIQKQKEDHQLYQETVKDTYNYGSQLLFASFQLRQSCKLPLEDYNKLEDELKASWRRLLNASQEQMTRLRVSAVFHRSVEDHCNQLRELREAVATIPLMDVLKKRARVKRYFEIREKLIVEVGRMVRLGRLLKSRLKEPLHCEDNKSDETKSVSLEDLESVTGNEIAIEAIAEKLTEVTALAEELDQALHSAHQDCSTLIQSTASARTSITLSEPETVVSVTRAMETNINPHIQLKKDDDSKEEEEFGTASESTLQHSRSSSYNTASECEQRFSPWWEFDKSDINEDVSKDKMVLAVGLPDLPPVKEVLKPSPEAPPGKIVHEVTETTHIKVHHSHTMGVSSFVLTSETVRDKSSASNSVSDQTITVRDDCGSKVAFENEFASTGELEKNVKECGDWMNLKILEITPELTTLGDNLEAALELQKAHDEVLAQLKNKQSPVEELLRQADQLIATQRPRTEVYTAMAESLGKAWKNINALLELRREILDLNVHYHTKAQEFFQRIDELEASCTDTVVPIEIDAVKDFLNMIHDLRRALLESLMDALQSGNLLLVKLKELGTEGTLDSRPDRIRSSVKRAISQVQGWMDQLHLKRQVLEATFNRRKTQLEQCLALAVLGSDLHELEDIIHERRELLSNTDQFGNSSSSAELLLQEHKKLLPEAQELQERALKITKATEQLLASGCFAGEQATEQSYIILSAASDYLNDLQHRETLINRIIAFFKQAQLVFNKLSEIEEELNKSNLLTNSSELVQLHSQCAKAIEDISSPPIQEGYAILDIIGRAGTEGVQRTVEELENRKISLDKLCIAHREENLRVLNALNTFLEKHNDIYGWLVNIADAFLQQHQDLGDDCKSAEEFLNLHNQLLNDLQIKGNEINSLLLTIPPILEFFHNNPLQRKDIDSKVEELHKRWTNVKNILEARLDLARIYTKFHIEANIVNNGIDELEKALDQNKDNVNDDVMKELEERWEAIVPLYQSAKNTGLTFINQANQVSEAYLNTKRACLCVESVLERLSGRQLIVTRNWQTFHTEVSERRELLVRLDETMAESTRTINWVTKLDDQLYPVITTNSTSSQDILIHLKDKLQKVLPDIKRAQTEVQQRIQTAEALISKTQNVDDKAIHVKNKLSELNKKLFDITRDYQSLLEILIVYFNDLNELQKTMTSFSSRSTSDAVNPIAIESRIREHENAKHTIIELIHHAQNECDKLTERIRRQEPEAAAESDIEKLRSVLRLIQNDWDNEWTQKRDSLQAQKQLLQFDADLNEINGTLDELGQQLEDVKGNYGESLSGAKSISETFVYVEKTINLLDDRINAFLATGECLLIEQHAQSPHIQNQISKLRRRWSDLKQQVQDMRNILNLSIQYFTLVEEANQWFREGSAFLVGIARKSATVTCPQEAEQLLNEIQQFLRPGEEKQNERIAKVTELATIIYGSQVSTRIHSVLQENKGMLDSFSNVSNELNLLIHNLKISEEKKARDLQEAIRMAKEEEQRKSEELARAAEEARRQAELEAQRRAEATRLEEEARRLAEQQLQRQAEEARRLAEQQQQRQAEEARRLAEQQQQQAEEARRLAEQQLQWQAEEARRLAEQQQQWQAEEARRLAEQQQQKQAEEARRLAEQQQQKQAEEARRLAEQQQQRQAEEARARAEAEAQHLASQRITEHNITRIHEIRIDKESSPSLTIEELEVPRFTAPLSDATIQEGSKFTFLCHVIGSPVPVVTWLKDGIPIQNNPDYQTTFEQGLCSLTIEETFAEDSAKYICKAINAAGSAESSAILSVKETEPEEQLEPPSFVQLLEPSTAKEGSFFELHCKVVGNPLPTVQWYKKYECIDNLPDYMITYNNGDATLRFDRVQLVDKSEYTCKAVNELGTAQSTADLNVTPIEPTAVPKFILPLSNVMARAGQKIKLECEVSGLPPPILTWSHNGKAVKETRELKLQFEENKPTLVVFEAFPKDAGTYVVTAKNIAGEASSSCTVSVKGRLPTETSDSELASDMEPVKPSIQLPLANLTTTEGNRVRLDCIIVGQPEPEVIWYHGDRPVKESPDFQLLFQGDRCSLVIQEAFSEDAGEYKVVALNSAGEASSACTLTVTPAEMKSSDDKPDIAGLAPKFIKLLSDVLVSEGDKVIFDANVIGEPIPQVTWLLNNQPLDAMDHIKLAHGTDGNILLEIENVRPGDKGVYTVKASNQFGDAKCFAQLIVKSIKAPETVKYEELKSAPIFKEMFNDRVAFEETSTKFECIVVGKPAPRVKWLFNGNPISGKQFLISTSGDRQVLSLPEVSKELEGTITCVAENEVGKASCAATLSVQSASAITLPELSRDQHNIGSSYLINKEVITQSSTSTSNRIISSTQESSEPHIQMQSYSSKDQQTFRQVNQEPPQISKFHQVEEVQQIGQGAPIFQQKLSEESTSGNVKETQIKVIQSKDLIKTRPPKFITPVIGKIVDQGVEIVLEGILDGQPSPQVTWTKNNEDLNENSNVEISFKHNKASLVIKNTHIEDAGRYTCTAVNESGKAVSTADLVVRKTVFPPVFGRRLQAQVIKKHDRVIMEVEVTGTPDPVVTWHKNGIPIQEALKSGYNIKSMGISHRLTIDKAEMDLNGRFMVRAVNSGGEAQSIADIAVFEPTPDTLVEVVKTVVFEDVRKHETLTSAADKVISKVSPPSVIQPAPPIIPSSSPQISSKSQFSSITEHETSKEVKVIKLEHTVPEITLPTKPPTLQKNTDFQIINEPIEVIEEKKIETEDTGIETSSISKQSSLQYFVKKIKQGEEIQPEIEKPLTAPEQIKPEVYKKFEAAQSSESTETRTIPVKTESTVPKIETIPIKLLADEQFTLQPEPPAEICYSSPRELPTLQEAPRQVHEETQKYSHSIDQSYKSSTSSSSYQMSSSQHTVERPASVAAPIFESPQLIQRPHSVQSITEPSAEALQMEKAWAHKFSEVQVEKSWPPAQKDEPKVKPSWSADTTLERQWIPQTETKSEQYSKEIKTTIEQTPTQKYTQETPQEVQHYIGQVTDVHHSSFLESNFSSSTQNKQIIEESNVKPSEAIKSWPPVATKPVASVEALVPIRPVLVQNEEIYLEPGSPPEIAFAPPPPTEYRQSYVEKNEQYLEKNLVKTATEGVRTVPPALPPKKELPIAPPIPAKILKPSIKPVAELPPQPFEQFPELQPFPFRAEPSKPRPQRSGAPPTPSKFIKGRFTDSDYESDFESIRIPSKWKPASSDTEEPSYRKVAPPKISSTSRSRSVEPEPLPPSKFDHPLQFQRHLKSTKFDSLERKQETLSQIKKQSTIFNKTQEATVIQPHIELKPGSPPIFMEDTKLKVEAPKVKPKTKVDGYMADTDEPLTQQRRLIKSEYRHEEKSQVAEKSYESSQQKTVITKTHPIPKFQQHKKHTSASITSMKKELVATPIITSTITQRESSEQQQHTKLEPFPFKVEATRVRKISGPPPPSPSKFVKGEFRESDYESDYEGRIPAVWRPSEVDGDPSYRPVRPLLTPRCQSQPLGRSSTPPTEFEHPPTTEGPPRPKFEPIEKFKPSRKLDETYAPSNQMVIFKPKPVSAVSNLQPGPPPEMGFMPGPQKTQYYRSTTSAPYHNAVQTETSNVMHFNESSENCHRTVSLQQTTKVIKFGEQSQRNTAKLEPFPYKAEPEHPRRSVGPPPPTPKKFIPGEFRESDNDSEVESTRIKPKWAPSGSESEDHHYRSVKSPAPLRSSSVPPRQQIVPPPSVISITQQDIATNNDYSSYKRYDKSRKVVGRSRSFEPPALQPGTPPEYGYIPDNKITRAKASEMASQHMDSMTETFTSKTQKFAKDILSDMNTRPKPSIKGDSGEQVYREETRAAQYGTKHVDPDTGLIYFKYDFGYEFGIILPGESKPGEIPVPKKTVIEPPKRSSDIELPVYHETTKPTYEGGAQFRQSKAPTNKTVKWDPTSESEMSEYEGEQRKRNSHLQGVRWEPSSCSPVSLSPSLPSTSPAFNNTFSGSVRKEIETPPSCPSTPGSTHSKHAHNRSQIRLPLFITPLRDIAVVRGQAAKFECIVQSEPTPNIFWSINGQIIEDSNFHQLYYRNGVCRLIISQAYPEDAGNYTCTATNSAGTANTTATLQVPGERRSTYIK